MGIFRNGLCGRVSSNDLCHGGEVAKESCVGNGGSGGTRDSQMTEGDIILRHWSGGESDLIY